MNRPWHLEALIAVALLALGAFVGVAQVRAFVRAGGQQMFYQSYFEPAVMWTCGRGFVRTINGPGPGVAAFLRTERDAMSCAEIPRDAAITTDGLYQRAWLYLMLSVGTVWWITGISWSGLAPLFGLLYGATIAAAYGIFRIAAGRVVSILLALALTVSTLHLQNLPHLRDYAKAPFVLVLILLMGLIVTQRVGRRSLLILAALYGLVLGIGYGFRSDLLASIPPLLLAVAFLPGGWRANLVLKAAMVAVALAVFGVVAAPVMRQVTQTGSCLGHVTLLGFSSPFTAALGVEPAAYDLAIPFNDEALDAVVTAYGNRRADGTGELEYCAPAYDRVTAAYLGDTATTLPADVMVRAYGASRRVLNAPFEWIDPPGRSVATLAFRARAFVLKRLQGAGVPLAFGALVLVSVGSLRLAVFWLLALLYFGGLPASQFAPRHYFHLEFIGWFAIGLLLHQAIAAVRRAPVSRADARAGGAGRVRQPLIFIAIAIAVMAGPLALARAIQQSRVIAVVEPYAAAAGDPVGGALQLDEGTHSWRWVRDLPPSDLRGRMLRAELLTENACDIDGVVSVGYRAGDREIVWERPLRLRANARDVTTVLVPVVAATGRVSFERLACARVQHVSLIDPAGRPPLLLYATLTRSWRSERLYQRLSGGFL